MMCVWFGLWMHTSKDIDSETLMTLSCLQTLSRPPTAGTGTCVPGAPTTRALIGSHYWDWENQPKSFIVVSLRSFVTSDFGLTVVNWATKNWTHLNSTTASLALCFTREDLFILNPALVMSEYATLYRTCIIIECTFTYVATTQKTRRNTYFKWKRWTDINEINTCCTHWFDQIAHYGLSTVCVVSVRQMSGGV